MKFLYYLTLINLLIHVFSLKISKKYTNSLSNSYGNANAFNSESAGNLNMRDQNEGGALKSRNGLGEENRDALNNQNEITDGSQNRINEGENRFPNSAPEQPQAQNAPQDPKTPAIGVSSTGATVPDVPVAQGLGGEVYVPCSECLKLMHKFVTKCVDQEANGAQAGTFRAFCEDFITKKGKRNDFCMNLNAKIAAVTGETGQDVIDTTKAPDVCIKFKNECDKNGGGPRCYTGFCDQVAECIECPSGLVDSNNDGNMELEVCSGNGRCLLGWYDDINKKGGNGYCVCSGGAKGLSCNQSA